MLARVLGVHTEERGWRIGADGEEAVAARLAKLPDTWRVLHAVPIGNRGSDIDHVVIGPGGVYTVNAKHHPHASVWVGGNTFMVNGHKQPYVRNSRYEAARASRILTGLAGLPVFVTGVIAVIGAHEGLTIKSQPPGGDVYVVPRKRSPNGYCNAAQCSARSTSTRCSRSLAAPPPGPASSDTHPSGFAQNGAPATLNLGHPVARHLVTKLGTPVM